MRMADEAYALGGETAAESYLNTEAILEAIEKSGADGVHPGYGFFSENTDFARAITDRGGLHRATAGVLSAGVGCHVPGHRGGELIPSRPHGIPEASSSSAEVFRKSDTVESVRRIASPAPSRRPPRGPAARRYTTPPARNWSPPSRLGDWDHQHIGQAHTGIVSGDRRAVQLGDPTRQGNPAGGIAA